MCVPIFRSVSFFVVAKRRRTDTQTNRHTYLQVKIGISLTGCSPRMDFDNFSRFKPKLGKEMGVCLGVYMSEVWKGEENSAKNLA